MLNSNEKPASGGLPVPAVPVFILAIWALLWLVNDYVYNLPKRVDVTVILATVVLFLAWCFGAFSKKGA